MSAARRILYLCPWVDVGGSDRNTIDLLAALDRARFQVVLATTLPSRNRGLVRTAEHVEEVWPLPDLMPGRHFASCLLDLVRAREVSLVHISNARLGLDLLPALSRLPRPPASVVQLHEAREDGLSRYAATRYDSLIDAYSVVSAEVADLLDRFGVSPTKRHLIHVGVDAEADFDPARVAPADLGPGDFHVLWPARLAEQKDPLLMVEVADALRRRVPGAVVHAVGGGPLAGEVEAAVSGVGDAVRLHPEVALEMAPWYRAADAVLLTSRYEGVPYAAFESLAMQTPFVGPALGGVRELVDGTCGRLVERREDPDAYADALAELAGDPGGRAELGRAGRERVLAAFTSRECARRHQALYEELLER